MSDMAGKMDDREIWPSMDPLPTLEEMRKCKEEKDKYLAKSEFPIYNTESNNNISVNTEHGKNGGSSMICMMNMLDQKDDGTIWPPTSPMLTMEEMLKNKKEKEKYLERFEFPFCSPESKYRKLVKIGHGTYGEVFKAVHIKNNTIQIVAMKRILNTSGKQGFPFTALREIKILLSLKHKNVVELLDICEGPIEGNENKKTLNSFYLVFEFCEHDLAGLISNKNVIFEPADIKEISKQLLNGLYFLHANKILHRDIKSANILITKHGVLKIADFGLARSVSNFNDPVKSLTNTVVTLWYRPPEILLGDQNYGPAVDMWGVGCILVEMYTRFPFLRGGTEQGQLNLISDVCGSITPDVWPGLINLPLYNKIVLAQGHQRKVRARLGYHVGDALALDLFDKIFILDPKRRIDCDSALNHKYFWSDPMPCSLSKFLSQVKSSNFEYILNCLSNLKENANKVVLPSNQ